MNSFFESKLILTLFSLFIITHFASPMKNTVLLIEHNLDLIKTCDYIIDLGPEGGDNGGNIIAKGTPEEVAENPNSYTGLYLKKMDFFQNR